MTRGLRSLALAIVLPAALLLAGRLAASRVREEPPDRVQPRLAADAAKATAAFDRLVAAVARAAETALTEGPERARAEFPEAWAARLEGVGVVRAGSYESWDGTPAEPSAAPAVGARLWTVRSRGVRTSLIARTAPAEGRFAIASYELDLASAPSEANPVGRASEGATTVRWSFAPPAEAPKREVFAIGPPPHLDVPVLDPRGDLAAVVTVERRSAATIAAHREALARASAAALFAALVLFAALRTRARSDLAALLEVTASVAAARAALVAGRTLEELLPRGVASPSLYGRGDLGGLCASPAAVAATAAAAFVIVLALALWARGRAAASPAFARLVAGVGGLAAVGAAAALGASLARDARIAVPRLDPGIPVATLLTVALGLVVAGGAELLAVALAPRTVLASGRRPSRLAVLAMVVPVAAIALVTLHRGVDRIVDERLRTEYAPLVLEQSAHRRMALASAVAEGAATAGRRLSGPDTSRIPELAFDLWSASDLFERGFASSLDVTTVDGERLSHFGFGLPSLRGGTEGPTALAADAGAPAVDEEAIPIGAAIERVLHATSPIRGPSGAAVGRVVGHVLEDPGNLPFLPSNAPYLRALGRGSRVAGGGLSDEPDYVLYDPDARVAITTLLEPPPLDAALRRAAGAGAVVEVESGGVLYRALALEDARRVHLLLTPARGRLDAFGNGVRLVLVAGAIVLLLGAGRLAAAPGGIGALADGVRASFHRKLLAAVLLASGIPVAGVAVVLRGAIERRGESDLGEAAASVVSAAQRVVADYQAVGDEDPSVPPLPITDDALSWLRRVVGQEIHLYEGGVLAATSKPELFDSALLPVRLPGEVDRAVVRGGRSFLVRPERLGDVTLPVAYARVEVRGGPADAVLAVPLVLEQRAFSRSVDRLVGMLLLGTTALAVALAALAALLARQVAEPVRRLAAASRRIAQGDYAPRLASRSRDEIGSLVVDFNHMAGALARQRADLERRRDYIEAVLRNATTGVVSVDALGRVVTINPAAAALLGEGAPSLGQTLDAALARSAGLAPVAAALSGAALADETPIEVDLGGPDHPRRLRLVRVPLPDPSGAGTGALVLLDDVTSLMRENQLAAWAEMARAIAHEIKNPLTPIQLSAEHLRRLLADRGALPSPEIEACLDAIARQVRELRDISRAFSTYARLPDLAVERVAPAAFLGEVMSPYRAAPPDGVKIVEDYGDAPEVLLDRKILARAVVNLVANALDAMPRGGTLTVSSRAADGDGGALLRVADTGTGIAPQARARLFEPYFSTKSGGTGLGLAIVRRVVEAHGGTIEVEPRAEGGTAFTMRLPAASPRLYSVP